MILHIKTTNSKLCYFYTKKTKLNTEIRHYKPTRSSSFSPRLKLKRKAANSSGLKSVLKKIRFVMDQCER